MTKTAMAGLAALALLIAAAAPAFAQDDASPPPPAPREDPAAEDDAVAQDDVAVERARELIFGGAPHEALEILRPLAEAGPGDTDAWFFRGMAAATAASMPADAPGAPPDPAAREALRDEAIAAYRHILDARPGLAGARLELARVLFERGRCLAEPDNLLAHIMGDDCDAAAYHYRLALAGDLPDDIVEAVSRFLAVIRARKRFSGSFSFAVAPDTNINSATAARTLPADIHIYGLPGDKWLLSEEQREASGIGAVVSAFGEYTHPLTLRVFDDSFTRLRAGGGVYRREYARRRFDDMTVFLHAGPQLLFPRGLVALLAKGDQRWYRGEPLSRAFGARVEGALGLNERLWVRAGVEWLERRYRKSDSSDGPRLDLDAELTYSLTPAISIGARAGWARNRTESKGYRTRSARAGAFVSADLPPLFGLAGFEVGVHQDFVFTRYDEPGTRLTEIYLSGGDCETMRGRVTSCETQRDRFSISRIAASNDRLEMFGFVPAVSVIHERRSSNVDNYEYRRTRAELTVRRLF